MAYVYVSCYLFSYIYIEGNNAEGKPVFLKDIWPTRSQIQEVEKRVIVPALYNKVYGSITVCEHLCLV